MLKGNKQWVVCSAPRGPHAERHRADHPQDAHERSAGRVIGVPAVMMTKRFNEWRCSVKGRLALLAASVLLGSSALPAVHGQANVPARFMIIDTSGLEMTVTNLVFDYTHYPAFGFYTPVHERGGFRVVHGEGELTIRWADVVTLKLQTERIYFVQRDGKRLEFTASEEDKWREALKGAVVGTYGEAYKYTAAVALRSGTQRPVNLIPVTRPLSAKSELGDYTVLLEKVREIRVIQ